MKLNSLTGGLDIHTQYMEVNYNYQYMEYMYMYRIYQLHLPHQRHVELSRQKMLPIIENNIQII